MNPTTAEPTDADPPRDLAVTPQERLYSAAALARALPLTPARLFQLAAGTPPTEAERGWLADPAGADDRRRVDELRAALAAARAAGTATKVVAAGGAGAAPPTKVTLTEKARRNEWERIADDLTAYPVHVAAARAAGLDGAEAEAAAADLFAYVQAEYPRREWRFGPAFEALAGEFLARRDLAADPAALGWDALVEHAAVLAALRVDADDDRLPWRREFKRHAAAAGVRTAKGLQSHPFELRADHQMTAGFDNFRRALAAHARALAKEAKVELSV